MSWQPPVSSLSTWQVVELARHPDRPYALDYIHHLSPGFIELRGDRLGGDDPALVAGVGTWKGVSTVFLGQQKGRNLVDRVARNWGMMHPTGYRKAMRMARQATKFRMPIVIFIDTPGAYPGAKAEEMGIASAIGTAIMEWFQVPVPVMATVIGEGGSGGALGLAIADRVLMLQNSIYSVAAPEAAASILWRDPSRKYEAAEQFKLTASDLLARGFIDEVVSEPPGGAHLDRTASAEALEAALLRHLAELQRLSENELLAARMRRFRQIDASSFQKASKKPGNTSGENTDDQAQPDRGPDPTRERREGRRDLPPI